MIIKSLYILFLLTFLVLPFFYHRKKSKQSMTKFYLRMAFSHNFRKCYRLVLLSVLFMFHFYHLSLFKQPLELAPSSVICLLLFSHRVSERAFRFLQHERTLLGVALFSVVCLFVTDFLPLGVTTGALVFGAAFYPSRSVCHMVKKLSWRQSFLDNPEGIIPHYRNWKNIKQR